MADVKIKVITYEESRLEHFKNKRSKYQKKLDLIEQCSNSMNSQAIQEKHFQLSQAGEIVQYYDDIVKMLEADVVPKSEVEKWFRECEELQGRMIELEKEVAREIFEEIGRFLPLAYKEGKISFVTLLYLTAELDLMKKKYTESEDKG